MADDILSFYENLAGDYHLIFEDWDDAIQRQAKVLGNLLAPLSNGASLRILDCACGIGTQAIGLAVAGHSLVASDLSSAAVRRAQAEAERRNVRMSFHISDMVSLAEVAGNSFDVVIAMDNALPHLNCEQLSHAAAAIRNKLRPGGTFMASIRDYDALVVARPAQQEPAFYGPEGARRFVHQVWDWSADSVRNPGYVLHLYITIQSDSGWRARHFISHYNCLLRQTLTSILSAAGFADIRWVPPSESGYYQPIVLAKSRE